MRTLVVVSIVLVGLTVSHPPVEAGAPFPQVDEAWKDSSFQRFRTRLVRAVRSRDAAFVLSVIDRNIEYSFAERRGIAGFRRKWRLERKDSAFWPTIAEVLRLGGSLIRDDTFCAPYVYSLFPNRLDPVDYAAIIVRSAPVRSRPSDRARVLERLSYDIVRVLEWTPHGGREVEAARWAKIVTPRGRRGYVSGKHIRSPLDYRACFEKSGGKWLMTTFIAGD